MSRAGIFFHYLFILFQIAIILLRMYVQIVKNQTANFFIFVFLLLRDGIGLLIVNVRTNSVLTNSKIKFLSLSKWMFAFAFAGSTESEHEISDGINEIGFSLHDRLQLCIHVIRGSRYQSKVLSVNPQFTCLDLGLLFGMKMKRLMECGIVCKGKFVSKTSSIGELGLRDGDDLVIVSLVRGGTKDYPFKSFDNSLLRFMKSVDNNIHDVFRWFPRKDRSALYQRFLSKSSSLNMKVFDRDIAQGFLKWLSDSISTCKNIGTNALIPAEKFPKPFIQWFSSQPQYLTDRLDFVQWPVVRIEGMETPVPGDSQGGGLLERDHFSSGQSPANVSKPSEHDPSLEATGHSLRLESQAAKIHPLSEGLEDCSNSKERKDKRKSMSGNSPPDVKRAVLERKSSNEFSDQEIPQDIDTSFRESTSFDRFRFQQKDVRRRIYVLFASENKLKQLLVSQLDTFEEWVSRRFNHYAQVENLKIDEKSIGRSIQDRFFDWLQGQDITPEGARMDTSGIKRNVRTALDFHGTFMKGDCSAVQKGKEGRIEDPGRTELEEAKQYDKQLEGLGEGKKEAVGAKGGEAAESLECGRESEEESGKRKHLSAGESAPFAKKPGFVRKSSHEFFNQEIPQDVETSFMDSTSFERFRFQHKDFRKRIYLMFASENKLKHLLVSQSETFRKWVSQCFDHYAQVENLKIDVQSQSIGRKTQDRFFDWLQGQQDISPEGPRRLMEREPDLPGTIPNAGAHEVGRKGICRAEQKGPGNKEGGSEESGHDQRIMQAGESLEAQQTKEYGSAGENIEYQKSRRMDAGKAGEDGSGENSNEDQERNRDGCDSSSSKKTLTDEDDDGESASSEQFGGENMVEGRKPEASENAAGNDGDGDQESCKSAGGRGGEESGGEEGTSEGDGSSGQSEEGDSFMDEEEVATKGCGGGSKSTETGNERRKEGSPKQQQVEDEGRKGQEGPTQAAAAPTRSRRTAFSRPRLSVFFMHAPHLSILFQITRILKIVRFLRHTPSRSSQ
jgi:hypothetical protein